MTAIDAAGGMFIAERRVEASRFCFEPNSVFDRTSTDPVVGIFAFDGWKSCLEPNTALDPAVMISALDACKFCIEPNTVFDPATTPAGIFALDVWRSCLEPSTALDTAVMNPAVAGISALDAWRFCLEPNTVFDPATTLAGIFGLDVWRSCLEPGAALDPAIADKVVPRFALEPGGIVTSFFEPPAAAPASVPDASSGLLFSSSSEFFFRRVSELAVDAVDVDFLRLRASATASDGRGWIVPAASDGTGPSGTFDRTAVADMVLTTSLARDVAVGDLFGDPAAASAAIFAAEPVGDDFATSNGTPEAIFATEPGGDFFVVPNPTSPPSATLDAFFVTSASVADNGRLHLSLKLEFCQITNYSFKPN